MLRSQEYIELIKSKKIQLAIQYLKKYLVVWSDVHLNDIQKVFS